MFITQTFRRLLTTIFLQKKVCLTLKYTNYSYVVAIQNETIIQGNVFSLIPQMPTAKYKPKEKPFIFSELILFTVLQRA